MTIQVFSWNVVLVAGLVCVMFLRNVVREPLTQRRSLTSLKTWTLNIQIRRQHHSW